MDTFILTVAYILAGLYGVCVGSFLNVVIYRLPAGIKMTNERSMCPKCKAMIHWYDNIPLLSYIILGGKCRNCKEPISCRYPIIEATNMLGWLLCVYMFKDNLIYAAVCAIAVSVCICVFMIDLDCMLIYDRFNIILAVLGLGAVFVDGSATWYSHLIGCAVGFLSFLLIGLLVSKAVGQEALGGGDIKFAGAMGFFLGWEKLLVAVLIASLSAVVIMGIARLINKKGEEKHFPFGPFLVAGFCAAMFFGNIIISAYMNLLYT